MEKPPIIPPKETPPRIQATPSKSRGKLTLAGVALAAATVLATIGASWLFPFWIYPRFLSPGVYPRFILTLPIVFSGVAVAVVGTWLLRKLRIPTNKEPDDDSNAA